MKYLLTSFPNRNKAELMLENIVPTKTTHLMGYGSGITFTTGKLNWSHSTTFESLKLSGFSDPSVAML